MKVRQVLLLSFLIFIISGVPASFAQTGVGAAAGSLGSGKGSSAGIVIEAATAISTATESFTQSADDLIQKYLEEREEGSEVTEQDLQEIASTRTDFFTEKIRDQINKLRGDGALTLDFPTETHHIRTDEDKTPWINVRQTKFQDSQGNNGEDGDE